MRERGIQIKNMNGFEYTSCDDSFQVYMNGVKITPGSFAAEDGFETYAKARWFARKFLAAPPAPPKPGREGK